MEDEMSKLLDSEEEIWSPKEGDKLIGVLVNIKEHTGRHGSNLYLFKTEGKLVGIWGSLVIADRLKEAKIGDTVGIKYLGMETSKSGSNYKNYKIIVQPKEPEEANPKPEETK